MTSPEPPSTTESRPESTLADRIAFGSALEHAGRLLNHAARLTDSGFIARARGALGTAHSTLLETYDVLDRYADGPFTREGNHWADNVDDPSPSAQPRTPASLQEVVRPGHQISVNSDGLVRGIYAAVMGLRKGDPPPYWLVDLGIAVATADPEAWGQMLTIPGQMSIERQRVLALLRTEVDTAVRGNAAADEVRV